MGPLLYFFCFCVIWYGIGYLTVASVAYFMNTAAFRPQDIVSNRDCLLISIFGPLIIVIVLIGLLIETIRNHFR